MCRFQEKKRGFDQSTLDPDKQQVDMRACPLQTWRINKNQQTIHSYVHDQEPKFDSSTPVALCWASSSRRVTATGLTNRPGAAAAAAELVVGEEGIREEQRRFGGLED